MLSINDDLLIDKDSLKNIINNIDQSDEYNSYFRMNYIINKGICQPLHMFNNSQTINSLEKMTNEKINNLINKNLTINIEILKFNIKLENFDKIKDGIFLFKWTKLVCNYILELFIKIRFPLYCHKQCQIDQLSLLTSHQKSFSNLKFFLFDQNSNESPIEYSIKNVYLYETVKYYEEVVYIQSIIEEYYMSISFINSNTFQIPILLSKTDKTLFIIKNSLDYSESSSIYVSIRSLIPPDLYLRHENSKIKISKYDQSILFRQDATFKLIFNQKKDLLAFQAINLPDYSYIATNEENTTNLTLIQLTQPIQINKFNKRFIFRLIPAI